jgi:predicted aconitase with swiveling domain
VLDHRHPLRGECLSGNVLVLPKGKGSSTGSAVLLDALVAGNAPSAIVMKEPDEIIALGVVVFEEFYGRTIPVIVLGDDDFTLALRSSYADISPDGTVILHESAT